MLCVLTQVLKRAILFFKQGISTSGRGKLLKEILRPGFSTSRHNK
jgi:hypothetical protein